MKLVVPYLLMMIKFLNKVLFKFQCFLVEKFLQNSPSDNPVSEKYRALRVDAMPIIEKRELLDYRQFLLGKLLLSFGIYIILSSPIKLFLIMLLLLPGL